ncbi:MAG: pentapeptide repeat-containing protein [Anaerolineales bacterium]|nr:pentapeptide repeat-containing protein [Anaerolineales bacterium]
MMTKPPSQAKTQIQKIEEWVLQHPGWFVLVLFLAGVLALIVYWAIWADISPEWTGFGAYNEEINGPRAKTLWDWMELLLVPIFIAIAGFMFSYLQKQTELEKSRIAKEEDREIAKDQQRQQIHDEYVAQMWDLIQVLDKVSSPEAKLDVQNFVTSRTQSVIRKLDAQRNRDIVQFLDKSQLSIDFAEIDLEGADLERIRLIHKDFNGATLRDTNLRGAVLFHSVFKDAKLEGADLEDAFLAFADFQGAKLQRAKLKGAYLSNAKLMKANLLGADVDDEQLLSAILSDETIMPDGRKYEEWKRTSVSNSAVTLN